MFKKIVILIIFIFIFCFNLIAQQNNENLKISRSFQGINLGIQRTEFEKIAKEKNITIQGELEVYFNQPDKSVVATIFPPYFRKILFFFYRDTLSMIIFFFESKYISVYEEYSRLYSKYGTPIVNQKQFIWEDSQTLLILEKDPFIVKLIDKELFNSLAETEQNIENIIQQSMDNSLDTL
ncbi:MAG: hypothetical protein GYA61_06495 [Spirochaetales bacterium]|jgi:hypothetical protein|nr:hypothetical protein [Exilispira sp.]NMC67857.1 hypothetical protein [Spirochaetales bacterium]